MVVQSLCEEVRQQFLNSFSLKFSHRTQQFHSIPREMRTQNLNVKAYLSEDRRRCRCPSANEWISERWHFYAVEYCLSVKREEVLIHATVRMDF